jgi:hypothetical protein
MTEPYKGWTIYWGMYGTHREIMQRIHTYWADISRDGATRLTSEGNPVTIGTKFETREAAIIAARQTIDQIAG